MGGPTVKKPRLGEGGPVENRNRVVAAVLRARNNPEGIRTETPDQDSKKKERTGMVDPPEAVLKKAKGQQQVAQRAWDKAGSDERTGGNDNKGFLPGLEPAVPPELVASKATTKPKRPTATQ